jgi:hypothetical protein
LDFDVLLGETFCDAGEEELRGYVGSISNISFWPEVTQVFGNLVPESTSQNDMLVKDPPPGYGLPGVLPSQRLCHFLGQDLPSQAIIQGSIPLRFPFLAINEFSYWFGQPGL